MHRKMRAGPLTLVAWKMVSILIPNYPQNGEQTSEDVLPLKKKVDM